jgi:hypothetical protein
MASMDPLRHLKKVAEYPRGMRTNIRTSYMQIRVETFEMLGYDCLGEESWDGWSRVYDGT